MSVIALDHVTLSVGSRAVLRDVSCAIAPGEFIGVLGPNGAGKTTLFRAILGLIRPDAGRIAVFGCTPQRGDAAIGYLPQVRTLLPDLRVRGRDFIVSSLHGERWGLPLRAAQSRKAVEETLAAIGARELAERPLAEMSGGERQRLLLAQALLGDPKLLLLDEPLISLDQRHQESVVELVRRFARARGITVLFSAHELNQLIGALDRVLYLGNGQAALGTGAHIEVVHAHGNIFVLSRGHNVERADHLHDHDHGDHDHGHGHHHDHRHV
jgi:zinc/manganese transport system ATP-binding protein